MFSVAYEGEEEEENISFFCHNLSLWNDNC